MTNLEAMEAGAYERAFVRNRHISMTHLFPVKWTEDGKRPVAFAFGYWTHDNVFVQGFADYDDGVFTTRDCQFVTPQPAKE